MEGSRTHYYFGPITLPGLASMYYRTPNLQMSPRLVAVLLSFHPGHFCFPMVLYSSIRQYFHEQVPIFYSLYDMLHAMLNANKLFTKLNMLLFNLRNGFQLLMDFWLWLCLRPWLQYIAEVHIYIK